MHNIDPCHAPLFLPTAASILQQKLQANTDSIAQSLHAVQHAKGQDTESWKALQSLLYLPRHIKQSVEQSCKTLQFLRTVRHGHPTLTLNRMVDSLHPIFGFFSGESTKREDLKEWWTTTLFPATWLSFCSVGLIWGYSTSRFRVCVLCFLPDACQCAPGAILFRWILIEFSSRHIARLHLTRYWANHWVSWLSVTVDQGSPFKYTIIHHNSFCTPSFHFFQKQAFEVWVVGPSFKHEPAAVLHILMDAVW